MTRTVQHQRCISALALGAMFVTAVIGTPAAQAQTYTVLHRFTGGTDGATPYAGLIGTRQAISTALPSTAAHRRSE